MINNSSTDLFGAYYVPGPVSGISDTMSSQLSCQVDIIVSVLQMRKQAQKVNLGFENFSKSHRE